MKNLYGAASWRLPPPLLVADGALQVSTIRPEPFNWLKANPLASWRAQGQRLAEGEPRSVSQARCCSARKARRDLYRAKTYGPRPTSPARLRELEHATREAEMRLKRVESPTAE
jgi:hypothetical protein